MKNVIGVRGVTVKDHPAYAMNVAYVEMESEAAAIAAIARLDGMDVQGTSVRVSRYYSPAERDRHRQQRAQQQPYSGACAVGIGMTGTAMAQATVAVHMPMLGSCAVANKGRGSSSGGVVKAKVKKVKAACSADEW